MKAIETLYNGYRFRSRLEARWAVFFDTLGIEYEYEPEGFELPSGEKYLPDFKVKCYGTRGSYSDNNPFDLWVEVKGEMSEKDSKKIKEFFNPNNEEWTIESNPKELNSILIVGNIPNPELYFADSCDLGCYERMNGTDVSAWNYETIDGDYFGAYPAVYKGHFYLDGDDCNYTTQDPDVIRKAFAAARQARFEYGETPSTGSVRENR